MKFDIKNRLGSLAAGASGLARRFVGWDMPSDEVHPQEAPPDQQQWRKLASPGQRRLAQVLTLKGREAVYLGLAGFGILAIPVALWASSTFASGAASSVSWLADRGYTAYAWVVGGAKSLTREKTTLVATKAPQVAPIQYVEVKASADQSQIKNIDEVRELMLAWGPLLDKGLPIPADQCVQDKKIHEGWFGNDDTKIRCRVSADKKRVWAWGYAFVSKDPARRGPYQPEGTGGGFAAVLYRAAGIDGWTLANVPAGPGSITMYLKDLADQAAKQAEEKNPVDNTSKRTQIDTKKRQAVAVEAARDRFVLHANRVPRSIGADFPELVLVEAAQTPAADKPAAPAVKQGDPMLSPGIPMVNPATTRFRY